MNLNTTKFFNSTDIHVSSRMNEYLKKNFGYEVEGDLDTLKEARKSLEAEQVELKKESYMNQKYMENMLMIETISSLLKAHDSDKVERTDELLPALAVGALAAKAIGSVVGGAAKVVGGAVDNTVNASKKSKGKKKLNATKEAVGEFADPIYDLIDDLGASDNHPVLNDLIRYLDGDTIKDFVADFRRNNDLNHPGEDGDYGEDDKNFESKQVKEGIDDDGIDPATGKQRIGLEGGYDFDEYTVGADSDGVLVTFGNDEIEIERSDWNDGKLSIKVNDDPVLENSKEGVDEASHSEAKQLYDLVGSLGAGEIELAQNPIFHDLIRYLDSDTINNFVADFRKKLNDKDFKGTVDFGQYEGINEDDEEKGPDHYRWKNDSQLAQAERLLAVCLEELDKAIEYRSENSDKFFSGFEERAGVGSLMSMKEKLEKVHDGWDESTEFYAM